MFRTSALTLLACAALACAALTCAASPSSARASLLSAPRTVLAPTLLSKASGVTPPRLIQQVNPHYPRPLFGRPHPADVDVQLIVGPDGVPRDVKVTKSGGEKFDKSAVSAVSKYRFLPAEKDGHPVAVTLNVAVKFRVYH